MNTVLLKKLHHLFPAFLSDAVEETYKLAYNKITTHIQDTNENTISHVGGDAVPEITQPPQEGVST